MNRKTRLLPTAGLAALLLTIGCASSKPSPSITLEPDPTPTPIASPDHSAELKLGAGGTADLAPVYFDTDRALLRADARAVLKRHAVAIKQRPEWGVVTIEGHCDERGSDEYNLALGERRAAAVARYLTDLGVPTGRLETRSFGEERPAVVGHEESAWGLNRRSELRSESYDAARR